jgi:phosphate transport system substrate-binding protein
MPDPGPLVAGAMRAWSRRTFAVCSLLALTVYAPTADAQDRASAPQLSAAVATGAGSTFIQPLFAAWAAVYKEETRSGIEYRPTGSGAGLAELTAGTADFSATDQPLTATELAQGNLTQFPIAIGAIVPVVNITGVTSGKLRITGPLLADIFAGKVAMWDDPAIAALNPGVSLPKSHIAIVHRDDSSGTTYNFTHYLSQVSASWKGELGEGKSIKWPAGIGASGNDSVADWVKKVPNSIGYVEYSQVLTKDLTYACLQSSKGKTVCPGADTFVSAVRSVDWTRVRDFNIRSTDLAATSAYPIIATTFVVMPRQPKDRRRSDAAIKFLRFGLEKGQNVARALNFVPLPPRAVAEIVGYIGDQIQ